jgi:Zn-finger nucleic acid-binding protein
MCSMTKPEIRYPCPVCLGVKLEKLMLAAKPLLVLDYCQRCGGIWFDEGEVQHLREVTRSALWARVRLRETAYTMKCHSCKASMGRNDLRCSACSWTNTLECPVCGKSLEVVEQGGLRLDICRGCRGAWFDNVELSRIWNRSVQSLTTQKGTPPREVEAGWFYLPDVIWLPLPIPAPSSGTIGGSPGISELPAGEDGGLLDGVGDALGSAGEWTADLASNVFDGIADAFDGLDFF